MKKSNYNNSIPEYNMLLIYITKCILNKKEKNILNKKEKDKDQQIITRNKRIWLLLVRSKIR